MSEGNLSAPTAPRWHLLCLPYMAGLLGKETRVQKIKDGIAEGTASMELPVMCGNRAAPMAPQLKQARLVVMRRNLATAMPLMPMRALVWWMMIRTVS